VIDQLQLAADESLGRFWCARRPKPRYRRVFPEYSLSLRVVLSQFATTFPGPIGDEASCGDQPVQCQYYFA